MKNKLDAFFSGRQETFTYFGYKKDQHIIENRRDYYWCLEAPITGSAVYYAKSPDVYEIADDYYNNPKADNGEVFYEDYLMTEKPIAVDANFKTTNTVFITSPSIITDS